MGAVVGAGLLTNGGMTKEFTSFFSCLPNLVFILANVKFSQAISDETDRVAANCRNP
jgi:hypothetical protein